MTFDYTSMGFHTFDALCRPVSDIPPNGDTFFVDDFALAVSGAAGSAAIVAAKHGLAVQAVGGVGHDLMGDWVLGRFADFGVDTALMQRCEGFATSSSIVTTRPDGARPALHRRGATAGFHVDDAALERVLDTRILHVGGVGLMDAMDGGRNAEVLAEAKRRGVTTTLDVFASTPDDLPRVLPLLEHTDYFMPSEEEAMALSGLTDFEDIARFLLDHGAGAVILTLGADGAMYRDAGRAEDRRAGLPHRRRLHLRLRRLLQRGVRHRVAPRTLDRGLHPARAGVVRAERDGPRLAGRPRLARRHADVHGCHAASLRLDGPPADGPTRSVRIQRRHRWRSRRDCARSDDRLP